MRVFGPGALHVPRIRPQFGGLVGRRRQAGAVEAQQAAVASAAEYRQVEALVSGVEGDAVGKVGDGRTQVHLVLVVDRAALVLDRNTWRCRPRD